MSLGDVSTTLFELLELPLQHAQRALRLVRLRLSLARQRAVVRHEREFGRARVDLRAQPLLLLLEFGFSELERVSGALDLSDSRVLLRDELFELALFASFVLGDLLGVLEVRGL